MQSKDGLATDWIASGPRRLSPTFIQQLVRTLFYSIQFTSAYLIMLLSMYFNGYLLISIILGGTIGYFVANWDTLGEAPSVTTCCHA